MGRMGGRAADQRRELEERRPPLPLQRRNGRPGLGHHPLGAHHIIL